MTVNVISVPLMVMKITRLALFCASLLLSATQQRKRFKNVVRDRGIEATTIQQMGCPWAEKCHFDLRTHHSTIIDVVSIIYTSQLADLDWFLGHVRTKETRTDRLIYWNEVKGVAYPMIRQMADLMSLTIESMSVTKLWLRWKIWARGFMSKENQSPYCWTSSGQPLVLKTSS